MSVVVLRGTNHIEWLAGVIGNLLREPCLHVTGPEVGERVFLGVLTHLFRAIDQSSPRRDFGCGKCLQTRAASRWCRHGCLLRMSMRKKFSLFDPPKGLHVPPVLPVRLPIQGTRNYRPRNIQQQATNIATGGSTQFILGPVSKFYEGRPRGVHQGVK